MKKMISVLMLLALMLCALPMGAAAEEAGVQQMLEALPQVDVLKGTALEEQQAIYTQV